MAKYHINNEGNAKECNADDGNCLYGMTAEQHYPNKAEAQAAWSALRDSFSDKGLTRTPIDTTPRDNWVEVDEKQADNAYKNYRAAAKNFGKGHPAGTRKLALQLTADRYNIPVSQLKVLVHNKEKADGVDRTPPNFNKASETEKTMNALIALNGVDKCPVCQDDSTDKNEVRVRDLSWSRDTKSRLSLSCFTCYLARKNELGKP